MPPCWGNKPLLCTHLWSATGIGVWDHFCLGGLRSVARIFSPLLARKSSGFARILHDFFFARKWLFEKLQGGCSPPPPPPPRTPTATGTFLTTAFMRNPIDPQGRSPWDYDVICIRSIVLWNCKGKLMHNSVLMIKKIKVFTAVIIIFMYLSNTY